MSKVIGLPLLKGNSNVAVSVSLSPDASSFFEGQAVGLQGNGSVEPVVVALDDPESTGFYGFVNTINACSGKAVALRAAESVALPADGSALAEGDQVLIDPATGLISATGSVAIAGVIHNNGQGSLTIVNGKTGALVANGAIIQLSVSPVFAVPPVAAAAAKSTKPALTDK